MIFEPLVTSRLLIRAPLVSDAEALNLAVLETFDQLHRWMPWAVTPPTLEESQEVCERMSFQVFDDKDLALFCFERATGEFVMSSGLHPLDLTVPSFMIGYWCRASRQRQGFATEAVQAITAYGLEIRGARRIEIRCDTENHASRAVAERCGYRLEGERKHDSRNPGGALRSTLVFAVTRGD